MKKGTFIFLLIIILTSFWISEAPAAEIDLFDWAFNIDDVAYEGGAWYPGSPSSPIAGLDDSLFDWDSGLGTLTWQTSDIGNHSFLSFFDLEFGEWYAGYLISYNDEKGMANGSPAAGQSWEMDEPGFGTGPDVNHPVYTGDIYYNVVFGWGLDDDYFYDSYT